MRCVDVNLLVYAHRAEVADHADCREWLDVARLAREPLGLIDVVASAFLRITTNHRIFPIPTPLDEALSFLEALRGSPAVVPLSAGERHWGLFVDLCRQVGARGDLVPDAYLAAICIEQGATWVSTDRDFARFPELRWVHPLDR